MALNYELWDASELTDEHWHRFKDLWRGSSVYETAFMDPDFARLIQDVRGDVSVIVAIEATEIIAFWPLHVGAGRRARGVGSPFSDRNGPIIKPGSILDLNEALRSVSLTGFKTQGLVDDDRTTMEPIGSDAVYLTDISEGYASFLAERSREHSSYYKKIRRLSRKVESEFDTVTFVFDDKSDAAFEELIALKRHQFSRTSRHDVLRPEWVMAMLDGLRKDELPDSRTVLSTLRFDSKLVAAELNVSCGRVLHGWLVAYDQEFSKYSPGKLIIQRILEGMPEHGMTIYDSGIGAGYYKEYYSNRIELLRTGTVVGAEHWFNPANLIGSGWSFLEKQTPGSVSEQMGRIRRRYDQIVSTETSLDQKAIGMAKALKAFSATRGS